MNEIVLNTDIVKAEELKELVIKMNDALVVGDTFAEQVRISDDDLRKMDYKEVKHFEHELSLAYKNTEEARKAFNRAWDEPRKQIEAKYKECVENLKERHEQYRAERARRDGEGRMERYRHLEDFFWDFCEANGVLKLAEGVTFEKVLDQKWLNKSVLERTAELELLDRVSAIIDDWNMLGRLFPDDVDEATRIFFETLSLKQTERELGELQSKREAAKAANAEGSENDDFRDDGKLYEVRLTMTMTGTQVDKLFDYLRRSGIHGTKSVKEV